MKENWERVKAIFDEGIERPRDGRAAWLETACAGDRELRQEVEQLLQAHDRSDGILDRQPPSLPPPDDIHAPGPPEMVGPYRLLREIGRGGMAEVYQARDERLGRFVALKFLPADLSDEEELKMRFLSEAKAVSALDHPAICTVFDLGESEDGRLYIAMGYYEGQTLAQRIEGGPLPVAEAIEVACSVADGLAHAHGAGVIHRDIKPSNLFLTSRGEVKILDFGVAKLALAEPVTQPGALIGTPSYMAPEQIQGKRVDHRADLWSLGVVLFESLVGSKPFNGEKNHSILGAILFHDPPPPTALRPELSKRVEQVVLRALMKNPDQRYQSAAQMLEDLEALRSRPARRAVPARPYVAIDSSVPGNLPVPMTSFVGREAEIDQIEALLPLVRVLTLTGPAGTGKTRLALETARRATSLFPQGVFFVPLASVTDPGLVLSAIGRSLGVQESPGRPIIDTLTQTLRHGRRLVVLDNFEQVVRAGPALAQLLSHCPDLKTVLTSRIPLHIDGEHQFPVDPLALPRLAGRRSLQDLRKCPSVVLFEQRARAATGVFALDKKNAGAVAELCVKLDGLPLAIELAAARIKLFSPQTLLSRLGGRLGLLQVGLAGRPARHQTLRQAIAWSYDLLSSDEKRLFRRLSVFQGGFTLEAAESVANDTDLTRLDVPDAVFSLLDQSLVRHKPNAASDSRFQILETIREYGLEKLEEAGERQKAEADHSQFFLRLAEEAEPQLTGSGQGEWLDRLEGEHDNLRKALSWALQKREVDLGLRLVSALWRFWLVRGYLLEGDQYIRGFLSMTQPGDVSQPRACAMFGLGTLAHNLGNNRAARDLYEESLSVFRTLQDQRRVAATLSSLAWVACETSEFDTARTLSKEGLELSRALEDKRGMAVALNNLGWVANYQGDYEDACRFHTDSLLLRREIGDRRGTAFALSNLGWAEQYHGDYEKAQALLHEATETLRGLNDRGLLAWALIFLGLTSKDRGDMAAASRQLEESVSLWKEVGNASGGALAVTEQGGVLTELANFDRGERLLRESLSVWEKVGCPWGLALTRLYLGRLRQATGAHDLARELYVESLGDYRKLSDGRGVAECCDSLAGLEFDAGNMSTAVVLFASAAAARENRNIVRPLCKRAPCERLLADLRGRLSALEFQEAWQQGRDSVNPVHPANPA